jgi:hypothetical protein
MEVRFNVVDRKLKAPESGSGFTVNFSSRGLLLQTATSLRPGQHLAMTLDWPALLSGTCPLKFVADGRVLRVDRDRVAVTIEHYEFRTRRTREWPKTLGLQV